ncbi:hypothetical protein HNO89_003645 [Sporosarcina luteola]|nr:hypothetical protein [Sporosarcina luteola]
MFKRGLSTLVAATFLTVSGGQAFAAEEIIPTSGSIDLTNVAEEQSTSELTNDMVTPFSVNVGGGVWDYGTKLIIGIPLKKLVYSNYNHPSKVHSASCSIGTTYNNSGPYPAGSMAPSSAEGKTGDSTRANWKVE